MVLLPIFNHSCLSGVVPIVPGVVTQIVNTLLFILSAHQSSFYLYLLFIYLFGVLCRFQHCTGHITTGSWKGRGNQYIQFIRVLYCKLPTNGKQLPAFPLEAMTGIEPPPQRWEARVLPLCHRGPPSVFKSVKHFEHSFAFDAPKICNELPHDVRSAASVASFRKKFKSYLFAKPICHSLPCHIVSA